MKPKDYIAALDRTPPVAYDRREFLCLDCNENLTGFSSEILGHFKSLITSETLNFYPDPSPLYEKLSHTLNVTPQMISISQGSDGVIKSIFDAYVEPGDEILLLSPTFGMFSVYMKMYRASEVPVPFEQDLTLPVEKILERISRKTKLVCIVNPNSPTGSILSPEEMVAVAEKSLAHQALLVIDEAYFHYYGTTCLSLLRNYENVVILRSFSKALGIAALRLGFAVAAPSVIANLLKVRPMRVANAFAIAFGAYLLDHPHVVDSHVEEVLHAKRYVHDELLSRGVSCPRSYTNFLLIDMGNRERAQKLVTLMQRQKILIKGDFADPPLERYARVTIGPRTVMALFLQKFDCCLREL